MAILRTYLFAPGNNQKLLHKVFDAGSDAVVLDLEDAVPPSEKKAARAMVASALERRQGIPGPAIYVRINAIGTEMWQEDLAAVTCEQLHGIRIPKAESPDEVNKVVDSLVEVEHRKGLPAGSIGVACTIESAKAVGCALQLACCARVTNLLFGATDFVQDIGADPGEEELETLVPRAQLVLASRSAGIDPPVASVYTRLADDEGLRRSTEANRRLGFFGRSVIHPRQIPIVHQVFTPRPEAVEQARKIVEIFEQASAHGLGTVRTEDGQFVDLAVVRRAQALLLLERRLRNQ